MVGIESYISNAIELYTELLWVGFNNSFYGKSDRIKQKATGNILPYVYDDNGEYIEVLASDNSDSIVHFDIENKIGVISEQQLLNVNIFFAVNLSEVYGDTTRSASQALADIIKVTRYTSFTVANAVVDIDAYSIYDLNEDELIKFNMQPYYIIKLETTIIAAIGSCESTTPTIKRPLTISIDGDGVTVPAVGSYQIEDGTTQQLIAAETTEQPFVKWVINEVSYYTRVLTLTIDKAYKALASFIAEYTLTIEASENGTTDPVAGEYTHNEGAEVSVEAIADENYEFEKFTEDGVDKFDNPLTVIMNSAKSVAAFFSVLISYQWLFTSKSGEIVDNEFIDYGTGGNNAVIGDVQVATFDGTACLQTYMPPVYDLITSYYNGIIDYDNALLKDVVSGYDATINDLDFTITECIAGIPFASKASVTFPASVPILGGLTIPIQLLYQNYDLENQAFCKHEDRITDDDGKLIAPARVIDITIYSEALTGDNLTEAETFFEVPIMEVNSAYVDPINGNDTTGSGTYLLPYSTISKANADQVDMIYCFSGNYDFGGIPISATKSITGVGDCKIFNYGTSWALTYYVNDVYFGGFKIDGQSIASTAINFGTNCSSFILDRCVTENTTARGIRMVTTPSNSTIRRTYMHCVNLSKGVDNAVSADNYVLIEECAFYGEGLSFATMNNGNNSIYKMAYNKFYGSFDSVIMSAIPGKIYQQVTIIGNIGNFDCNYYFYCYSDKGYSQSYDKLTMTGELYKNSDLSVKENNYTNIIGCDFISKATNSVYNFITLKEVDFNFSNNIIEINSVVGPFLAYSDTNDNLIWMFNNNEVHIIPDINREVIFGDYSLVSEDKATLSFAGNIFRGSNYYGGSQIANVGVVIYGNANSNLEYNNITGYAMPILLYGNASDYSNTIVSHNILIDGRLALKGVNNTKIYNNVFKNTISDNSNITVNANGSECLNTIIKNNIFENLMSGRAIILFYSIVETIVSDRNVMYSSSGYAANQAASEGGLGTITFSAWQALGYDLNSTDSDPNLNSNYTPIPAIQGGEDLGTNYDQILTSESIWPDELVLETQPSDWHKGAIYYTKDPIIENNDTIENYEGTAIPILHSVDIIEYSAGIAESILLSTGVNLFFQEGISNELFSTDGVKYYVIGIPTNFWDTKSDTATSILSVLGYTLFLKDGTIDEYKRVIYANGQPQESTISGYAWQYEVSPNVGFSNTGETVNLNPNSDAAIQTVLDKYSISVEQSFETLSAIDFSAIDENELKVVFENNTFTNWELNIIE